jgi:hypothetical protein
MTEALRFIQSNVEPLVVVPNVTHSDDVAVLKFSNAMRAKLAQKRIDGRGGWNDPAECSTDYLRWLLANELRKPIVDLVDVANYCMMLHQRGVQFLDETSKVRDASA